MEFRIELKLILFERDTPPFSKPSEKDIELLHTQWEFVKNRTITPPPRNQEVLGSVVALFIDTDVRRKYGREASARRVHYLP